MPDTIPLPSELKSYHEILMMIMQGSGGSSETQSVLVAMIRSMGVREVVGVRGLALEIDDIEGSQGDEEDAVSTVMWNPLHFAVYYQNTELLRFLLREMRVNFALTAPKAPADSERDPVNHDKYTEDKIMLTLIAYDRKNP